VPAFLLSNPGIVISTEAPHSLIVRRAAEKSAFAVVVAIAVPLLCHPRKGSAVAFALPLSLFLQLLLGKAGLQPGV